MITQAAGKTKPTSDLEATGDSVVTLDATSRSLLRSTPPLMHCFSLSRSTPLDPGRPQKRKVVTTSPSQPPTAIHISAPCVSARRVSAAADPRRSPNCTRARAWWRRRSPGATWGHGSFGDVFVEVGGEKHVHNRDATWCFAIVCNCMQLFNVCCKMCCRYLLIHHHMLFM